MDRRSFAKLAAACLGGLPWLSGASGASAKPISGDRAPTLAGYGIPILGRAEEALFDFANFGHQGNRCQYARARDVTISSRSLEATFWVGSDITLDRFPNSHDRINARNVSRAMGDQLTKQSNQERSVFGIMLIADRIRYLASDCTIKQISVEGPGRLRMVIDAEVELLKT